MRRVLFVLAAFMMGAGMLFAEHPKYVFVFIGDGMSTPQRMVAEEFARSTGHGEVVFNKLPYHATTRTCSASSLVTDSAAAATAIACGCKTYNSGMGVDVNGQKVESIAELAHKHGQKIGIVTTVTICHATPAGFYAHRKNRGLAYQIGLDLVNSGFEYFAGGGMGGQADKRDDPEYKGNLYELAAQAGYKVVEGKAALAALKPEDGKVWMRSCEGSMPFAIDADPNMPTLADMTRKGIELLDNPNGFFMMVEGGRIDYACHANDAGTNLREILAFDNAVREAHEFSKKHPGEVLIVTTGDHETGGMAMGFAALGYQFHSERLGFQTCSVDTFSRRLNELKKAKKAAKAEFTFEDTIPLLNQSFGFVFNKNEKATDDAAAGAKFAAIGTGKEGNPMVLSDAEIKQLKDGFKGDRLPAAARQLISGKAGIGWSSGAHTAMPVLTTSEGKGAETIIGLLDNTEIAIRIKALYE